MPTLEQIEGFSVTGISTITKNADEQNANIAKIAALWQEFYQHHATANTKTVAVYSDYETDVNGLYKITLGPSNTAANTVHIPAGNYLVFRATGPMPQTVIALWQSIWNYFAQEPDYQRLYTCDFEEYTDKDQVAIYISIQPR